MYTRECRELVKAVGRKKRPSDVTIRARNEECEEDVDATVQFQPQ